MDGAIPGNDAEKGVFLGFVEEYGNVDQAVAEAVGMRKDLRKRIKGAGYNLSAFDRARKLADLSSEKREEQDRALRRYLDWLDKPLGYQESMFPPGSAQPQPAPQASSDVSPQQVTRTEDAGRFAAQAGQPRTANPWTPGTFMNQVWDTEWLRATTAAVPPAKPTDNDNAPPPARRHGGGRPKGAKDRRPRRRKSDGAAVAVGDI